MGILKKGSSLFCSYFCIPVTQHREWIPFSSFCDQSIRITFLTCLSKDNLQVLLHVEELELKALHSQVEVHSIASSVSDGKASRLLRSEKADPRTDA